MSMQPRYDIDRRSADQLVAALRKGGPDAAAALTASWSRRQLVWTCLALGIALNGPPAMPAPVKPRKIELRPNDPQVRRAAAVYHAHEEALWTDDELREAHAAWNRGDRTPWIETGERIYQRLKGRRRRAAERRRTQRRGAAA